MLVALLVLGRGKAVPRLQDKQARLHTFPSTYRPHLQAPGWPKAGQGLVNIVHWRRGFFCLSSQYVAWETGFSIAKMLLVVGGMVGLHLTMLMH